MGVRFWSGLGFSRLDLGIEEKGISKRKSLSTGKEGICYDPIGKEKESRMYLLSVAASSDYSLSNLYRTRRVFRWRVPYKERGNVVTWLVVHLGR